MVQKAVDSPHSLVLCLKRREHVIKESEQDRVGCCKEEQQVQVSPVCSR